MFGDATVNVSLPAELGFILETHQSVASIPRWALEAILIEAVREGRISRGYFREVLKLSFHESEELLASKGVKYDFSADEILRDAMAANFHSEEQ